MSNARCPEIEAQRAYRQAQRPAMKTKLPLLRRMRSAFSDMVRPVVKPKRETTPKKRWSWSWPAEGRQGDCIVDAHTKSEARAMVKELLGIGSHGRLPIGVEIWECD